MKEMYSSAVKALKAKVKHSKEPIPKAKGLSVLEKKYGKTKKKK